MNLMWLGFSIVLFINLLYFLIRRSNRISNRNFRLILNYVIILSSLYFASIFFRIFIGQVFIVSSKSMENTLYQGDVIFVSKLSYGPLLSDFNIRFHEILNQLKLTHTFNKNKNDSYEPIRLSPKKHVQQGDIVVFKQPSDQFVIKRCIATSGNQLWIKQGNLYVNHQPYIGPQTIKFPKQLIVKNNREFEKLIDSLNIPLFVGNEFNDSVMYHGFLTNESISKLSKFPNLINISNDSKLMMIRENPFANPLDFDWDLSNMGPFRVPQKGETINLNPFNLEIYKNILDVYELNQDDASQSVDSIDDKQKRILESTFSNDYLFLMGDHRSLSRDSRITGFVPENKVLGKATVILFSYVNGRIDRSSFLRKVD